MSHIDIIVASIQKAKGRDLLNYLHLCNKTLTEKQLALVKFKLLEKIGG